MDARVGEIIESIYEQLPEEMRERLEQRKFVAPTPGTITEDDQKWIKEHIDEFFKKGGKGDERV